MTIIKHKVGDTVTIEVTVDNLSEDYISPELKLYGKKSRDGFKDIIKTVEPQDIVDNKFIFVYNTDDFIKYPKTYYGHFNIDNDGIILNNFYKIKATY